VKFFSTGNLPSRAARLACSRRRFLAAATLSALQPEIVLASTKPLPHEPVIDIHQHTHFGGRTHNQLIAHQKTLGIDLTILLPAGRLYGLDARCGGNQSVLELAAALPDQFRFFANEVSDLPDAVAVIRSHLQRGAIGIGEQKFRVASHSKYIERIAELAREFQVPVLLHFEYGNYNRGYHRFHSVLEKFPEVNFIGHAQTFWGNIDRKHQQPNMYPSGGVTPGGLTDRLLRDYRNFHGDLSGRPGLNALLRDEEHATAFFERHQDQLLFGSDCGDLLGAGPACFGAQLLATIRRLAPNKMVARKILCENARQLLAL
jgi:uncharacterized protein